MSYETGTAADYGDLLSKIYAFLTAKGTTYGLSYTGTGNGLITAMRGGANSVAETFTVELTSATAFDVTGSINGALASGTVGTPYADAGLLVEFTLTAGGTAFIAGDTFTFSTAPKWTGNRRALGPKGYSFSYNNAGTAAPPGCFDGSAVANSTGDHSYGVGSVGASFPVTCEIEYFEAETIVQYAVSAGSSSNDLNRAPSAWTLQYWNGSAWTTLDTISAQTGWAISETRTYTVGSPVSATRYRLNISANNGDGSLVIAEWSMRRSAGAFNTLVGQVILTAPGNDGGSAYICGIHPFIHHGADYYNFQAVMLDGYQAAAEFHQQPGISKVGNFMPAQATTMGYWIVANGRRVIVVAKLGSNYENLYLGAYDPFLPPDELPYPVCVGASSHVEGNGWPWDPQGNPGWNQPTTWSASVADSRRGSFTHSSTVGNLNENDATAKFRANLCVRLVDGTYVGAWAAVNKNFQSLLGSYRYGYAHLWPLTDNPVDLNPNFDGSYSLFPIQLLMKEPLPLGQLDGVAWVTGQGLGAESVLSIGPKQWIVLPDWNRSTRLSYYALELI